ncbi:putative serine protease 46 [Pteropus vampyrus]|uniref:Serine protease 46 n=1 Tax=Pteropus vampyrus TaxID=132908 RepID=A0A6P3RGT6_PTEVA|nr:putative serine protease 46 [Pteropus vampyrus]
MACGPGNLQGLTAPFSSAGLGTPFYVKGPWLTGCGQTNISCKVVKGQLVEVGKWPWQVSILFLGVYVCGGSLIHQQWVLTAAHCLQRSIDPKEYSVMVGVQHLPENLQEVAVKIIKNRICRQRYQFLFLKDQRKFIGNDVLCATSEWGIDSCQGNSGSSMVCQVNNTWVQMGVVSWIFSCNQHSFPGIYTSTAHFTHWIKKRVADMRFVSRAHPAFRSPVFLTGYTLLVSLGSLWLL